MRAVAATVLSAVVLGGWFYLDQQGVDLYSQDTYEALNSTAFGIAFVFALLLAGFVAGRFRVLLALVGPLLVLGYLQATGFVSPWHDGTSPLSLPTFAAMFWFGLLLAIGVLLRAGWDNRRELRGR